MPITKVSGRSLNDIAYEIVQAAPQVEHLVEEWFASLPTNRLLVEREDARAALRRIRAAAESDADLDDLPALRSFLLRETEVLPPMRQSDPTKVSGEACSKLMRGVYDALTTCVRPKGHIGKHDPIWNHYEWERPE